MMMVLEPLTSLSHLQASRSSMSHEVLMVSRSSAYFHLERSYLRLAAEAAADATAAEDRFSCGILTVISFNKMFRSQKMWGISLIA